MEKIGIKSKLGAMSYDGIDTKSTRYESSKGTGFFIQTTNNPPELIAGKKNCVHDDLSPCCK